MNLMDAKKSQSSQSKSKGWTLFGFIGDVRQEIGRISWTGKEELKVYTKIIVIATFSLGIGIFLVDQFIIRALAGLSNIVHWIAG